MFKKKNQGRFQNQHPKKKLEKNLLAWLIKKKKRKNILTGVFEHM